LNPFTGQLELQGFTLNDAAGQPMIAFSRLMLDVEAVDSLMQAGVIVEDVVLSDPVIHLVRDSEGRINLAQLLPPATPPAPAQPADAAPSKPLPLHIAHLTLQAGHLGWQDASSGQTLNQTLAPIELTVSNLSNQNDQSAHLELLVGLASGGQLQWQGDLKLEGWQSDGAVSLEKLDLHALQPWLKDVLPLQIVSGQASLTARYQFRFKDDTPQLLIQDGHLTLAALELAGGDGNQSLIRLPTLQIGGVAVDLAQKRLHIASVSSDQASIKAWREANGQLNYQTLFANPAQTASQTGHEETPEPVVTEPSWAIGLQELALNDYQIEFTDYSAGKPVVFNFSALSCRLQGYSNAIDQPLPIQLSGHLNQTGSFDIAAHLNRAPLAAEAEFEFKSIDLKTFQSYLDPWLALEVVDGDFNAKGRLQWQAADDLRLSFNGDAAIAHLITRDKQKNKDFLTWASLDVTHIAADVAKQDYSVGNIVFDKPYFRFTIKKDRTTNLDEILIETKTKESASPSRALAKQSESEQNQKATAVKHDDPTASPHVTIGKIQVQQGRSDFADYSLILPFVAQMNGLNGEIAGFDSRSDTAAQLKLQGKVYDMASVAIKGRHHFKSNDSAIDLSFKHMPLPLITPYMAEFAGYKIEKGQMALDLHYTIDHKRLQAQNKILIDQLVLGDKIDNPKAVNLPLELAVSLLKDSSGKINLDFPISGSLEDPKFSIGALVGDVLVNMISKVATAPFKAIAAMFDSDADLSTVDFVAGSSELTPDAIDKLTKIAKALKDKPELVLEIKAQAYHAQDWPMLSRDVVLEVLKKKKSSELREQQGERIRAEYIALSEADYLRLLAAFYAEVFPGEIDVNMLGKPRMKHNPDIDFYTIARLQLEAIMQPEPHRLNDLAIARSNRIAQYLSEQAGIDKARLYLLGTEIAKGEIGGEVKAILGLNVASH